MIESSTDHSRFGERFHICWNAFHQELVANFETFIDRKAGPKVNTSNANQVG